MFAKNLAQTPAGAIADDGFPDAPGSNEAGAHERLCFGVFQDTEDKRSTADGGAFRPNPLEFGMQSESARLRKKEPFLHRESLVRATAIVSCRQAHRLPRDGWQPGAVALQNQRYLYSKSLPGVHSGKTSQNSFVDYGVAEGAGEDVVLIVVFVSVLLVVAGEGFTTVVLVSFFSPAGGFTVSVFCSQAASNDAAPAKMQMYFFISCRWKTQCGSFHIRGKRSFRPYPG